MEKICEYNIISMESFLHKNKIFDSDIQKFVEENDIEFDISDLNSLVPYLSGIEKKTKRRREFFSNVYQADTKNPFLLKKIKGLELDTTQKLNISIIAIYEDVKKVMRNFDCGYSNSSFASCRFVNQRDLDRKFNKIARQLKHKIPAFLDELFPDDEERADIITYFNEYNDEEETSFNYYLYNLALILRDYDSHTLLGFKLSDEDAPFSHNYEVVRLLKDIALGDRPDEFVSLSATYLQSVKKRHTGISDEMNLKPERCFLLLHTILLHSMIDFGSTIAFNTVLTNKTNLPLYVTKQIASSLYGFGVNSRKNKKGKKGRKTKKGK